MEDRIVDMHPLEDSNDCEMIAIFLKAISLVSKSYLCYNESQHDKECLIKKHQERVFAYELYHQWSCLLEKQKMFEKGWVLNAELSKHLDWFYNEDKEIKRECEKSMEKSDLRFPDLVLHKGQENQEDNFLVCEIKRGERINEKNLCNDLYKLTRLTVDECRGEEGLNLGRYSLPFKYGIFLCLNKRMKDMSFFNQVCRNLSKYNYSMKNILCVDVLIEGDKLKIYSDFLCELYKKNNANVM